MSQNIQHNIALHKKKAAVLVEKGGARIPIPKQLDSEDPKLKRRRGPRERADDPKFGYTERLLSKTFDDGRVFTEEGSWTNMKLVVPSVPPPPPRAGVALSFMENLHIQGLFAYVLNEGPQPIREAYRFLAESGQDMRVLLSKFTFPGALRAYAQNFRVEKDVVHLNGNFAYGKVKFRVAQQPVIRRGYQPQVVFTGSTETSLESNWPPLAFREILAEDQRYFAQRDGAQPTGFALVQRVDRYVSSYPSAAMCLRHLREQERFATDPSYGAPAEPEGPPSSLLEDRPPWQLRQMEIAWREGWRQDAQINDENSAKLRSIRARITGWVTDRKHWCMKCRDRRWCRVVICGREGYKPANAVFRATATSLGFLAADQIFSIETFDRGQVDAEEDHTLEKFGDAVMEGLHKAEVVPRDEDAYFRDHLDQGLDAVREELVRAARATPELLGIVTRVMNAA